MPKPSTPSTGTTAPASPSTSAGSAQPASPTPLIASNHQPTPAQQNPQVRKPLAPSVAEANPNAPADPIRAFQERSNAAIAKRLKGHEREQIGGAGVDGASTLPKAGSPRGATPASSPKTSSPSDSTSTASTGDASAPSKPGDGAASQKPNASSPTGSDPKATPSTSEPSAKPSTSDDESTSLTSNDATSSVRENRYTFKDVKAWVEKNPEKAAEIRRIFDLGPDTDAPFIALQHKRRQSRDEIAAQRAESEKALTEQRTYIEERVAYGETMAKQLQPLTDIWAAVNQRDEGGKPVIGADGQPIIDFDMLDVAVESTTGFKMDDLIRRRARRGAANPELAKERARAARAERELQQLRAQQTNGAAKSGPGDQAAGANPDRHAAVAAPAAPKVTAAQAEAKWGPDVPKSHGLRELTGWAEELHEEMERFYDEGLNEYSVDTEVIADQILERRLSKLRGGAPAPAAAAAPAAATARPVTPKRKRRALHELDGNGLPDPASMAPKGADGRFQPKRAPSPGTVQDLLDPGSSDAPRGFAERERMAFANAEARLKNQPVPYPNLSQHR